MFNFSIEVDGQKELDRAFLGIERGISDLRPAWPDVATAFFEIEQKLFWNEGHGQWPELSPAYAAWKEKHYPFMPLMQRERDLYFSLTRKGAEHQVYEESDQELVIGTDLPYAQAHMQRYRTRPARPPILFREEDKRKLSKALQRYMVKLRRQAGFVQTSVDEESFVGGLAANF